MKYLLLINYTSDTTDTTDVPICVHNDACLMHEKTPREVARSQCSLQVKKSAAEKREGEKRNEEKGK